jgi:hypothetical protein
MKCGASVKIANHVCLSPIIISNSTAQNRTEQNRTYRNDKLKKNTVLQYGILCSAGKCGVLISNYGYNLK